MVRNRFDCPDWFVLFLFHFTIEPSHKEGDWKISRLEKSATFFESCSLKLVVFFKWPESALKLPYWRESTIKLCRNFPKSSLEMSLYKSFRLLYKEAFDFWWLALSALSVLAHLTSFPSWREFWDQDQKLWLPRQACVLFWCHPMLLV